MQVISSTSLKEKLVLKPCYRPRPILPLSAHGFPIPGNSISTSSFRFNQLTTPNRSVKTKKPFADNKHNQSKGQIAGTAVAAGTKKKACMCSPSKHPGAFRCTRHKKPPHGRSKKSTSKTATSSYHSSVRLRYRRLAMNNSLVRIGGVAGDMVKRALVTQVKSSGHNQRRRAHFQPKPSRLSVMSTE